MIMLHKKRDISNYRPISLLSYMHKLLTRILHKQMEEVLDKSQPREQAGFRNGYSTVDHLQIINQRIEKCNEFKGCAVEAVQVERSYTTFE